MLYDWYPYKLTIDKSSRYVAALVQVQIASPFYIFLFAGNWNMFAILITVVHHEWLNTTDYKDQLK